MAAHSFQWCRLQHKGLKSFGISAFYGPAIRSTVTSHHASVTRDAPRRISQSERVETRHVLMFYIHIFLFLFSIKKSLKSTKLIFIMEIILLKLKYIFFLI